MKAIIARFSLGKEVWDRFKSRVLRPRDKPGGLSLSLAEIQEPRLVAPDWVKIRSIMSGISDMDEGLMLRGDPASLGAYVSFPFVPGNENLGIVTDVGNETSGIEPGERVVVEPLLACGPRGIVPPCPSCSQGDPSSCRNFADGIVSPGMVIGACRDTAGGWGDSFIAHKSQVRAIPQNLESDMAILVPEFARAVTAVLKRPPEHDAKVIIVGAGSLGLLTLYALNLIHPDIEPVVVAEHSFEAEKARKLGAEHVIGGLGPGAAYEQIADLVEGAVRYPEVGRITLQGGADLVYETTGRVSSMEDAISFTGEGKTLVLMGINQPGGFDMTPLWFKGVQIRSASFSGLDTYRGERAHTFDIAMDLMSQQGIPFEEIVTHKFQLEEHSTALAALADRGGSKATKVVFQHVV